jgi:hypothetical protein
MAELPKDEIIKEKDEKNILKKVNEVLNKYRNAIDNLL